MDSDPTGHIWLVGNFGDSLPISGHVIRDAVSEQSRESGKLPPHFRTFGHYPVA